MVKQNISTDLGILLKLPNKVLDTLVTKINLCIGSAISDAINDNSQNLVINIGIGLLSISLFDMQCKFVPSKELKATIKNCINSKADPLEQELEKELSDKLLAVCSEVL